MFSFASLLIVLCWAGVNVILQFQFLAEALSLNGLNYLCLRLLKLLSFGTPQQRLILCGHSSLVLRFLEFEFSPRELLD